MLPYETGIPTSTSLHPPFFLSLLADKPDLLMFCSGTMRYRLKWSTTYNINNKPGTEAELCALLSRSGVRMFDVRPAAVRYSFVSAPVRVRVQNKGWVHGKICVWWPEASAVPVAAFKRSMPWWSTAGLLPWNAAELRKALKFIECTYQLRSRSHWNE